MGENIIDLNLDLTAWQPFPFNISNRSNINGFTFTVEQVGKNPIALENFEFGLFEDAEELKDENRLGGFNLNSTGGGEYALKSQEEGGINVKHDTYYILAYKLK